MGTNKQAEYCRENNCIGEKFVLTKEFCGEYGFNIATDGYTFEL